MKKGYILLGFEELNIRQQLKSNSVENAEKSVLQFLQTLVKSQETQI